VISIGKIADIYAHQGISTSIKATGLEQLLDKTAEQIRQAPDKSIIFTNLVNFDQDYGHRRDIVGYANALEYFDIRLGQLLQQLKPRDVLFITADHGCDPSWVGTDHTREFVPILCAGPEVQPQQLGLRHSFADMGQTIAELFELTPMQYGDSFVEAIS
jgi:phosphopentomutase